MIILVPQLINIDSQWYGNWSLVIVSILIASFIFTIFFVKPRKLTGDLLD